MKGSILKNLYDTGYNFDFKIKVLSQSGSACFLLHKCIMGSVCKHFNCLLEGDLKIYKVVYDDVSYKCIKALTSYIYTNDMSLFTLEILEETIKYSCNWQLDEDLFNKIIEYYVDLLDYYYSFKILSIKDIYELHTKLENSLISDHCVILIEKCRNILVSSLSCEYVINMLNIAYGEVVAKNIISRFSPSSTPSIIPTLPKIPTLPIMTKIPTASQFPTLSDLSGLFKNN